MGVVSTDRGILVSPQQAKRMARLRCSSSIDLHCHCLPGLDDGPETMEESLELCQALVADGITTAIATPHQLGRYDGRNGSRAVREGVTRLQACLNDLGIPLQILPGGDIRLDERLVRLVAEDRVTTLADGGKCLLVELPHEIYVDPAVLLERLAEAGLIAVITHPERHQYLQQHADTVQAWVEQGAVLQITAGSLVGEFGQGAQIASRYWIAKGWVGVVASDAHGVEDRRPQMTAAVELITAGFGLEAARALCAVNPALLAAGKSIPAMGPGNAQGNEALPAGDNPDWHRSTAAALG
jgi:protein-tyrosine phosphatase